MWRSSSVQITQKDLSSSRSGGSSNERSHGSGGAGVSPKIGRISTEKRSHFCASLQSGSCSENYAIPHDLSGQTLTGDDQRADPNLARLAREHAHQLAGVVATSRGQPRDLSLDQSQESGVACPGFEPAPHSEPTELGERCIVGPLEHHPLDQGRCHRSPVRTPQRNRNELGETTVNKT